MKTFRIRHVRYGWEACWDDGGFEKHVNAFLQANPGFCVLQIITPSDSLGPIRVIYQSKDPE